MTKNKSLILQAIANRKAADKKAHEMKLDKYGRWVPANRRLDDYTRAESVAYRFDSESIESGLEMMDSEAIASGILNTQVPTTESKAAYIRSKDLSFVLRFAAWLKGAKELPKEVTKVGRMFDGTLTKPMETAINYITPRYENTSGLRKNKKGNNDFTENELIEVLTSAGYSRNTATGDTSALLSFLHLMGLIERVAYLNKVIYSVNPLGLELLRKGLKANNL